MLPNKPVLSRAWNFDDVVVMPGGSLVPPEQVVLDTVFHGKQTLRMPLLGLADNAKQAITLAQQGSIGILSQSMPFGDQIEAMRTIKRYQASLLRQPLTVTPDTSAAEAADLQSRYHFSALPVVEQGTSKLVGIVTRRDIARAVDGASPISLVMTNDLITVTENTPDTEVHELLHKHVIGQVVVVDQDRNLVGLRTASDFSKRTAHPFATLDAYGRLLAGASVYAGFDAQDRILGLIDMGVDLILIEQDFAYAHNVQETITFIRRQRAEQKILIMAGNVQTADGARAMLDAGADMLFVRNKIEQGLVHVPAFTALQDVLDVASLNHIPVWLQTEWTEKASLFKGMAAGSRGLLAPVKDNSLIPPWQQELRIAIGQTGARSPAELSSCARLAAIS